MKKKFTYIEGQTPLDPNEIDGLIPQYITPMRELNELEQINVTEAARKYLSGRKRKWDVTDPLFLKKLHKDMFCDVWEWAVFEDRIGKRGDEDHENESSAPSQLSENRNPPAVLV